MKFKVSRRIVREGDIIEVKWECPEAESAQITIDNGYRSASAVVPDTYCPFGKLPRHSGSPWNICNSQKVQVVKSKGWQQCLWQLHPHGQAYFKTTFQDYSWTSLLYVEMFSCTEKTGLYASMALICSNAPQCLYPQGNLLCPPCRCGLSFMVYL